MSPNNVKIINQSDSSVESAVSSPARRSRSLSMASQSSSDRASPKTRHAGSSNSSMKCQRKSSSLPVETVEYLKNWMMSPEHIAHPYPTDQEKSQIMADTGIELKQLTNWFVNNRKRYWKPRVEARLQQQAHVALAVAAAVASAAPMTTTPTTSINTTTTTTAFQGSASYMSPPTAISFLTLDNMSQLPTPGNGTTVPKPIVSVTSSPVDDKVSRNAESSMLVTAENLAAYLTVAPSSPHTVSELSSSASDVGSVDSSSTSSATEQEDACYRSMDQQHHNIVSESSSDDMDSTTRTPTATTLIETVDVHILRPPLGRKEPTIEDVTILPNVPITRILRTFPNCALTYQQSSERANRKKMQSRRDAEIVRIKKHYLRCYLAERDAAVESFLGKRARLVADSDDEADDTPRLKYRCVVADPDDYWRQVCQTAVHPHDDALPSLEEAALMFGYTATATS